jgi:Cut12 conserved domain
VPDAPETPAPVFAIRAFKTAIFGTPHDVEDADERPAPEDGKFSMTRRGSGTSARPVPTTTVPDRPSYASSPSKPAGILMTPGTASTRRKTVSFGTAVVGNNAGGKSGLPGDLPGKYPSPSPWTAKATTPRSRRTRTNLNKSLYEARSTASVSVEPVKDTRTRRKGLGTDFTQGLREVNPKGAVGETELDFIESEEEGDATVDLEKPRSKSGRYWKTEYEKTDHEMKKLVKYKHLARSYAKKKDSEAVELADKLRAERKKVAEMEEKISELAGHIAASRSDENGADRSNEIVKGLARQTMLALEYKDKVDRFQAALEQHGIPIEQENTDTRKPIHSSTEQTLIQVSQELKRAREQLQELNQLRSEVEELRDTLKGADLRAQKLDEEKLSLSKDLEKAKQELERNDKRRVSREEKHKQREEKLLAQKNEYKERLLQAKADHQAAEEKLKKRSSDEKADLEQEIQNLQARLKAPANGSSGDFEKVEQQCLNQQKAIRDYEKQIASLRAAGSMNHGRTDESHEEWQQQQRKTLRELRQAKEEVSRMRDELRDCQAEIKRLRARSQQPKQGENDSRSPKSNDKVSNGSPEKHPKPRPAVEVSNTPSVRGWPSANCASLPNPVLLDLSTNPGFETRTPNPQSPERIRGSARHHGRRYSFDSPSPALPSPEETFDSRISRGQSRKYDSPRPSFVNIPSNPSPPKMQTLAVPLKTVAVPPPLRANVGSLGAGTGVRRTGSLGAAKARTSVPPDRAVAAKARLDQRSADKKRLQDSKAPQKENMVPGGVSAGGQVW